VWFRKRVDELAIRWLTQRLPYYERRVRNDREALLRHLRPGDGLRVDGDTRISRFVKYLTQSCWSHSARCIGDALLRRGGALAGALRQQFGEERAGQLLVEALPGGVVAEPVTKYLAFNLRILRPHRLRPEHLEEVLEAAISAIGLGYDLGNVLALLRYLFPVKIVPNRLRGSALRFSGIAGSEVICSSLLGHIFQQVHFPILPTVEYPPGLPAPAPAPRRGGLRRFFGRGSALRRESPLYSGLFKSRPVTLLTPRDFDLSPYFEVIKFNFIAGGNFDYRKIRWMDAGAGPPEEAPEALPALSAGGAEAQPAAQPQPAQSAPAPAAREAQ